MHIDWEAELKEDRAPFFTALLVGFAAHGYAFANKLVNHDEIESLFGKGATLTSGRWGLELVKLLFPDCSMPWIYGILSLLLMAVSVCLILRIVPVRTRPLRLLLAALIVSFPSLTGNFCFLFTAAPYAWSFFLTVLAVWLYLGGKRLLAPAALVLALGIYQAYIAVAASLLVLVMIARLLDGEGSVWDVLRFGLRALAMLLFSAALYYGVTLLSLRLTGTEFNAYVTENVNGSVGPLRRLRIAYDAFFYVFSFRNFSLISSEGARYVHLVLAALTLPALALEALRTKEPLRIAMLACLALLLPLAVCCMFLIMAPASIHTLVLYSFIAVYLLAALALERLPHVWGVRLGALCLALIVVSNVYFANKVYLKLHLQYENAYAFYTVLVSRVQQTPGFDAESRLALVGEQEELLYRFDELDTELFQGVDRDLVNIYSRENFLRYYLGLELPFVSEEELEALAEDARVQAMPVYPYDGSVQKLGDTIVVRLG